MAHFLRWFEPVFSFRFGRFHFRFSLVVTRLQIPFSYPEAFSTQSARLMIGVQRTKFFIGVKLTNTPLMGICEGHVFHGSYKVGGLLVCMYWSWDPGPRFSLRYHRRNPNFSIPMRELGPFWGVSVF